MLARRSGELGLPARSLKEDDHLAGDLTGHVGAEVFLDGREREVDARAHPGRGDDGAVANEEGEGMTVTSGNDRASWSTRVQ
jgi:hypothetical protein